MKEKELKELKLTKNIIIPFPNFQQNTIISPTQMNDNFEEIEHAYNTLIDNHNGALEKINKVLSDLTSSDNEAIVNEQERVKAEETRVQNEEQRISDEEERKTEETKRIAMYNIHLNDELRREQKHTEMVNTFNTKVGEVNTFVSTKKEEIDSFVDTKTEEVEEFVDLKTNQVNSFITTKTSEINAFVTAKGQEVQNAINAIPPKSELIGAKGDKGDKGDTPSITHLETSINNKINEVETRFNTLTSSQQQDAEVIDARVGENGKIYASLGNRLNEVDSQLEHKMGKKELHYVTPEMFGAKGDGITDDTEAFRLAFLASKVIKCKSNKVYYCANVINVRELVRNTLFDGSNSTFVNFKLEIGLKDDEYDWRTPYSSQRLEVINCDFGTISDNHLEKSYDRPIITSGIMVNFRNINVGARLVLLAYPDQYCDNLYMENVKKAWVSDTFEDDYNYKLIMRINENGDLMPNGQNSAGDGWTFIGCNEFRSDNFYIDESNIKHSYGLISTRGNSPVTFLQCIQSTVEVCEYSIANFDSCHFEDAYVYQSRGGNNISIKFDNCYFYGHVIPDVNKSMTFQNCFFRFGNGNAFSYRHGKSILKNSNVINCRFGDSGVLVNSIDLNGDIGCNYKSDDFETYGNPPDIDTVNDVTTGSFVGETTVTFVGKRLEGHYCSFKLSETFTLTGNEIIRLRAYCKPCMIFDFYIENNGVIYKGSTKTLDTTDTVEIQVYNSFFRVSVNYRPSNFLENSIGYPPADTLEIVQSIPEYTERTTLYRISKGLCVDTAPEPLTMIKRFCIIPPTSIKSGNVW